MPELPEVERAASQIRKIVETHPRIRVVDVTEDTIVYTGTTHNDFASALKGRTVTNVGRYGKLFYFELSGEGLHPVFHFGMTGMLQIKGSLPAHYRSAPRNASADWPPQYMKFIIHFSTGSKDASADIQVAFLDPRRLGRIRLVPSPLSSPPISTLGFDPVLCMPPLATFSELVHKRAKPVKALLLDQAFSAGVGNWVADEILYHARIHPERRGNTLDDSEIQALWTWVKEVPCMAVALNAEDKRFPENWLFKHRWGKGKKKKPKKGEEVVEEAGLKLPTGEPATIKWITVGGRTSAYVVELQRLDVSEAVDSGAEDPDSESDNKKMKAPNKKRKAPAPKPHTQRAKGKADASDADDDDDLTPLSGEEAFLKPAQPKVLRRAPTKKRRRPISKRDPDDSDSLTPLSDEAMPQPRPTRVRKTK